MTGRYPETRRYDATLQRATVLRAEQDHLARACLVLTEWVTEARGAQPWPSGVQVGRAAA